MQYKYVSRYKKRGQDPLIGEYMEKLIKALNAEYGEVKEEWLISLDLIAVNYGLILNAQKDIEAYGLSKVDTRGRLSTNPAVNVLNAAQTQLIKLINTFGLSTVSKGKVKNVEKPQDDLALLLNG